MAEELGTRDVLQQVDARLNGLEQSAREMHSEMESRFERVHTEMGDLRSELRSEISTQGRWHVGLMFASWLTLMASFWLKP